VLQFLVDELSQAESENDNGARHDSYNIGHSVGPSDSRVDHLPGGEHIGQVDSGVGDPDGEDDEEMAS
jgi:hypothetical protein